MKIIANVLEREHPAGLGGTQKLFRFNNGYGASVVRFPGSYGYDQGLWELAVIQCESEEFEPFNLVYDTPITDDVIGRLTESEVNDLLVLIQALCKKETSNTNHLAMTAKQFCAYLELCTGTESDERLFSGENPEVLYHMARGMWLVTARNVPHPVDFIKGDAA